ncbi:conserved unknown protein [Ectocarpus siliculosus]|uniref:IST1 homolog n=1 Tax=Ectocarpus siliculosus TaxID=2880 RepID=D8LKW4_ECTSI|nr:conserved unknown protein [Ectocarpus siliculosus]|eukprot:CBN80097.1 conserved unknown protein [Ectocarpus siliculosus]
MTSLLKKAGLVFDENKVKPFLKMSITRLNLLVNKKANHIKISKKEIARLLADGKEEKARIKVEQVIREDFTIEAYDVLELHCELVAERMRLVASQKDVPPDMEQAVCTIIWAADRAEVSELSTVKSQFVKKYGSEYVRLAELNEGGCVNPKVVEKLDCQPPSSFVVTEYLLGIAEEYDVEYTPAAPIRRKSSTDREAAAAAAAASGPQPAYQVPSSRRPSSGGGDGGGGGGGSTVPPGGGGISSPPPVTAWALPPSDGIPLATATLSPQNSFGGGGAAAGGGGSAGWDPSAAATPADRYVPGENEKGHYRDTSGGNNPYRRGSGGFAEATSGWGPSDAGLDAGAGAKGEDAPPPYSPPRKATYDHNDIPSPPKARPMPYDIPAAPGYEDKPTKPDAGDDSSSGPAAPSGGGDSELDDLAARFMNLRK